MDGGPYPAGGTAGAVEVIEGKPCKQVRGQVQYIPGVQVNYNTQPIGFALNAKAKGLPSTHGLDQARLYKHLKISLVFFNNGVEEWASQAITAGVETG